MSYEEVKTSKRDESLIPNTQIESMFLRICTDDQIKQYTKLIDDGHVSLATAYASNTVYKTFYLMIDYMEAFGLTIDTIQKRMKKGDLK